MEWYNDFYFYQIKLLNDSYEFWVTPLAYDEAKNTIGKQPFILMDEHLDKESQWELNTKVIKSIEDVTEYEHKVRQEQLDVREKSLSIIKEIRSIKLPRFYKWRYGLTIPPVENPDWSEEAVGMDIDYLMTWNEDYLLELLAKCEKRAKPN